MYLTIYRTYRVIEVQWKESLTSFSAVGFRVSQGMGVGEEGRKEGLVPFNKNRSAFILYIVVLSRIYLGKKCFAIFSTKIFENR